MLKVFGHVYANDKEDFETIKTALEREGFTVAYENEMNGSVIKEVNSLNGEEEEDAES